MTRGTTNQAILTFDYGSSTGEASSNIAVATLQGPIIVSNRSLENTYRKKSEITYTIALTNSSAGTLTNIQVFDNLGTYTTSAATIVTPLTYIGDALFYINGVYVSTITPVASKNGIIFMISALPAFANAIIVYKAKVNECAMLTPKSNIINTITVTALNIRELCTDSNCVTVEDYADISIIKNMNPNPIIYGGMCTYTFTVYNYGNTPASNVVLTDIFNPSLNGITVTVNNQRILPTDYNYAGGIIILPASNSSYSMIIPEATYIQDAITGVVTINPGVTLIKVSGVV